ncbi:hypothetical protein CEXT_61351 [Caerostris extrusa]|uniref:Uncharacterized protein n=1 Tax=Caerostris extrusa TaxID=172846 RepID=A0AAV4Q6W6_CAEEX|nr:hypothetical protein CEXT_61351 [Caerostris extrusa]
MLLKCIRGYYYYNIYTSYVMHKLLNAYEKDCGKNENPSPAENRVRQHKSTYSPPPRMLRQRSQKHSDENEKNLSQIEKDCGKNENPSPAENRVRQHKSTYSPPPRMLRQRSQKHSDENEKNLSQIEVLVT